MAQVRPTALDIFASLSYSAVAEVTAWCDIEGLMFWQLENGQAINTLDLGS